MIRFKRRGSGLSMLIGTSVASWMILISLLLWSGLYRTHIITSWEVYHFYLVISINFVLKNSTKYYKIEEKNYRKLKEEIENG